jgi:hypothetical protein
MRLSTVLAITSIFAALPANMTLLEVLPNLFALASVLLAEADS